MVTIDTANIPTEEPLRREWIKFQLRARGSSLSKIAREVNVTRYCPIKALRSPYPRIERAIAKRLHLRPEQIWPERYDENGRPNRARGRPNKSVIKDTSHVRRRNVNQRGVA